MRKGAFARRSVSTCSIVSGFAVLTTGSSGPANAVSGYLTRRRLRHNGNKPPRSVAVVFHYVGVAARSRCPPLQESVRNLDLDVYSGKRENSEKLHRELARSRVPYVLPRGNKSLAIFD